MPHRGPAAAHWTYLRSTAAASSEIGLWSGGAGPLLPRHFHDEVQISFVVSGHYSFRIGAGVVGLRAGQGVLIPAGLAHAPAGHDWQGTAVINAYVSRESCDFECYHPIVFDGASGGLHVLGDIAQVPDGRPALATRVADLLLDGAAIGALSRRLGRSREGFTRRFNKEFGMPPHAYRLITRLNRARALLRGGDPIAVIAAETGFADQSHLGRHFRRVFGATPAAYRKAF